ncbi:MAG TPA: hypothetical protein VGJ91_14055 [Polyangiaceae bacterium]|jgi:hypothetical protein
MAPADTEAGDEPASSTTEPLMWYVSNPAPTVIDFDRDPAQATIADGAIVDSTYSSQGVTFSCVSCTSGHAFARLPGKVGNGVSLVASPTLPLYDSRFGAVRADFNTPRSSVSLDVLGVLPPEYLGTPVARPWLEAYNSANQMIGSTVYYPAYGTAGFGQWQTLRIDDPTASIKWIRFSSQHYSSSPSVYGSFDNLSFNTDPYWVDITPVKKQPIEKPPILKPVLFP